MEGERWLTDSFLLSASQILLSLAVDEAAFQRPSRLTKGKDGKVGGEWRIRQNFAGQGQEGCTGLDTGVPPQIHILPGI